MSALEHQLALHSFMCGQFGYANMLDMLAEFNRCMPEDETHEYHPVLDRIMSERGCMIEPEALSTYGASIHNISLRLKMGADHEHNWKPHQYASLLLTEHYLNIWFEEQDNLCNMLNRFCREATNLKHLPEYRPSDLTTLAFQSATGSGKTLMMHAHLLQFQGYAKKHKHRLHNIYLVTPDADMSNQHLIEMQKNKIPARLFDKNQAYRHSLDQAVQIIDNHKIGSETKDVVIDVNELGKKNLVLVDEGHLGQAGDESVQRRRRASIAREGFTFEYSATFNQIVGKRGRSESDLLSHYSKCLIFDYSYRHFYRDGYGKDHSITNLVEGLEDENQFSYQVACMLIFYQQVKIFKNLGKHWGEYNITRPLWVMLGNTVVGKTGKISNSGRSDIIEVVGFFQKVLARRNETEREIKGILEGKTGLQKSQQDWFADKFVYLKSLNMNPEEIYNDVCECLFYGAGTLHITYLTHGTGELHLRSSDGGKVFGVINVGAPSEVHKIIKEDAEMEIKSHRDTGFSERLFNDVDSPESTVNILIGARKFIAGWNSWRVSTMTLLNVGKSQGPQIIQMFGRGVRLKGWNFTLKRHRALGQEAPQPEYSDELATLETLNVYGLKASYMKTFSEIISKEGIEIDRQSYTITVETRLPKKMRLPMLETKDGVSFEINGDSVSLDVSNGIVVNLNLYSQMQTIGNHDKFSSEIEMQNQSFQAVKSLFDKTRIYHSLIAFKEKGNMHNLSIDFEIVDDLLNSENWYNFYAPDEKMKIRTLDDISRIEGYFVNLACQFIRSSWKSSSWDWEKKNKTLADLNIGHDNIVSNYTISADQSVFNEAGAQKELDNICNNIAQLIKDMKGQKLSPLGIEILMPSRHLYIPIVYKHDDSPVTVIPLAINDGEKDVIEQIMRVADEPEFADCEIYLLRNASRKGTGFFSTNTYYPDFICWIISADKTHIIFLDPKGLVYGEAHKTIDDKVGLHKAIKDIENFLDRNDIRLHSYILSTSYGGSVASQEDGVFQLKNNPNCMKEVINHALRRA